MTATATKKPRSASKRKYDGPSPEEKLVADLVALMEAGTAPWRREWQGHQGNHRNLLTGKEYRGSNPLLLELGSMIHGLTLPLWLGGGQAKAKGWFPKKGSKAVRIQRPQLNRREDEKEDGTTELRSWVSYKVVPVFNAADLVGGDEKSQADLDAAIAAALGLVQVSPAAPRLAHAESVLEAWEVETRFGSAMACYSPSADVISMPAPEAFDNREAYCATWAHEQIHSTGHSSRLDRKLGSHQMGSQGYAREELVAELGAVLICLRLNIGSQMANHAAYLSNWIEILREKPLVLFQVLGEARKAADLICPEPPAEVDDTEAPEVAAEN